MNFEKQLIELLQKTEWNQTDRQELLKMLEASDPKDVERIVNELPSDQYELSRLTSAKMLANIHRRGRISNQGRVRRLWIKRLSAAAAVLLLLGSAMWFLSDKDNSEQNIVKNEPAEIGPGGNRAILTLADGTQVLLDSANTGAITRQGEVTVIKLDDGQLAYDQNDETATDEVVYNSISTPRGGQYQLVLSDGTKVWLNAESSLRFPTSFKGTERRVELTGEGYFEVSHNARMPFYVNAESVDVKVLGTHFNVNAYRDERAIRTTLIEGAVVVSSQGESAALKPGQQAALYHSNQKLETSRNVDMEQVIAWKNGYFSFNDASVQSIMRQFSRWYDVDVSYSGTIKNIAFNGKVYRDMSLQKVLEILTFSDLNVKIEGRKLIVSTP